ncbi:MAG: hypothetical protein LUD43_00555 [Firmicutes bacterium]|nr:hypothetical protein [Bacillota bacterium]
MKICRHCKNEVSDSGFFCGKCGFDLRGGPEPETVGAKSDEGAESPKVNGGETSQAYTPNSQGYQQQPYQQPYQWNQNGQGPQGWQQPAPKPYTKPYDDTSQHPYRKFSPEISTELYDNSKLYSVLSYIGIGWLAGLLIKPEKNNPRVRFNVGQGIIVSIVTVALTIIATIISALLGIIVALTKSTVFLAIAGVISALLNLFVIAVAVFYMVYGIINAARDKEKVLPIIGSFAFYR